MITLANTRFKLILMGIGIVLCIPLVAMLFTSEVDWNTMDFLVAFVLLLGLGITIEFVLQRAKGLNNKRAWIIIALAIFLLIWAELAVGIFGTPFAGN